MSETTPSLSAPEILDLASDAIALFDQDGLLVVANVRFRHLFGAVAAFLQPGTSWTILMLEVARHGLLPETVCDRLRLVEADLLDLSGSPEAVLVRGQGGEASAIRLCRTSNGGFAWVQSRTHDTEGEAEHRRQAELVMAKVLEACPASLTMSRIGDGQILYRTPSAAELMGNLRRLNEFFVNRIERADFITALLSKTRIDDMRIRAQRPWGEEYPASISARLIDYRGDDVVVANIVDLTEDLAMQAELARQKELNFQSEKMSALGELLAGVAHELNNPLAIVVGNALILREELQGSPLSSRAAKLSDAAERCVRIVRSFLGLVREHPLDLTPVRVEALVAAAQDAFFAEDPGRPIDIRTDFPQGLPDLWVDEVQMVQVLVNLLNNAWHAISETGRHGTVTISARCASADGSIVLAVRDDGPGVPKDRRSRVFDPLFTTKEVGKGTGMGLTLCQRIVIAHGGSIRLLDRFPGAVFEIRLSSARPPARD